VNTFVVEEFVRYRRVTYYTVKWDESELSETDKFITKYREIPALRTDLDEIIKLIEDIGRYRSAKDMFFRRHAGVAAELPPLGNFEINSMEINYFDNRLRLFCLKISENIVILFNGGEKVSLKTQDSPDLNMPFLEAQIFAKKIFKALNEKDILNNRETHTLESGYGDDTIVLS
jgi:hypothetical protein